jgi:mannose-6-phosphate isomerase-like protein (cupin superfamily)
VETLRQYAVGIPKVRGGTLLSGMSNPGDSPVQTVSTATADHYVWGASCDGWHLVRTPTLSIISERMPAGTTETAHRHSRSQQFFFVLSGELLLDCSGTLHTLRAREGAHVRPGVVHQARNVSESDVEFLVISEPPSHGDRINVG